MVYLSICLCHLQFLSLTSISFHLRIFLIILKRETSESLSKAVSKLNIIKLFEFYHIDTETLQDSKIYFQNLVGKPEHKQNEESLFKKLMKL